MTHDMAAWPDGRRCEWKLEVGADVPGQKVVQSGPVSVAVEERQKWAERRNGLKAKEAAA
jgi:hypothetical protein